MQLGWGCPECNLTSGDAGLTTGCTKKKGKSLKYDELFIANFTFRFKDSLKNIESGKEEWLKK